MINTYHAILITAPLLAYLFGSISSAIIVCKLMGLPDPRTAGSKNPGATNVLRLGGKKAAILTLLGDGVKGWLPVILAKGMGADALILCLVTFAAFFGHLFPVFFQFKGGKGVATSFGCLLALSLPVGLSCLATWLIVAYLFRYSSLSSLFTSLLAPFYTWYFTAHTEYTLTVSLMSLILIYRHRGNIKKLIRGEENKIGRKKI